MPSRRASRRGEERTYSHEEVWTEIDALEAQGAFQISYTETETEAISQRTRIW